MEPNLFSTSDDPRLEMPFDQYQRYRVTQDVLEIIKRHSGEKPLELLDVGGHSTSETKEHVLPIRLFVPDMDSVVLDTLECPLPGYVKGDGRELPFEDNSADVVICLDVLEHVPPSDRATFARDLLRVSRGYVILTAPFSAPEITLADRIMFEFVHQVLNYKQKYLKEHLENGHPRLTDLTRVLEDEGATFTVFPSGFLNNWLTMNLMRIFVQRLPESLGLRNLLDSYYNRHFYEADQKSPAYRQVVVVALDPAQGEPVLAEVQSRFEEYGSREPTAALPLSDHRFFQMMASLPLVWGEVGLYRDIVDKMNHIENLETAARGKNNHIRNLEAKIRQQEVLIRNFELGEKKKDEYISELRKTIDEIEALHRQDLERIAERLDRGARLPWDRAQSTGE